MPIERAPGIMGNRLRTYSWSIGVQNGAWCRSWLACLIILHREQALQASAPNGKLPKLSIFLFLVNSPVNPFEPQRFFLGAAPIYGIDPTTDGYGLRSLLSLWNNVIKAAEKRARNGPL